MEDIQVKKLVCKNVLPLLGYLINHRQHEERNIAVSLLRNDCQDVLEDNDHRQSLGRRTQINGHGHAQ